MSWGVIRNHKNALIVLQVTLVLWGLIMFAFGDLKVQTMVAK